MVNFRVGTDEAILPAAMALIPPFRWAMPTACGAACLTVTVVGFTARASPITNPPPTRNPVSAMKRLRMPAHLLLLCWVPHRILGPLFKRIGLATDRAARNYLLLVGSFP